MTAYPQLLTYRKLLIGLLVLNLLAGAYLILDMEDATFTRVLLVVISVAISVFYLVVLITLINIVEYFEARFASTQDRLIRLERSMPPTPARSRDRLID